MLNAKIWKKFNSADYFSKINIPENWETLEDFAEWYMESRMPMMISYNAPVIRSDDATAICLFRKGQYQVELYLEYPEMWIRNHSHPRVEVINMFLGGGSTLPPQQNGTSIEWGSTSKIMPGEYHSGSIGAVLGDGMVTLAFEKWQNIEEMTSAAINWKGEIHGPIQANLIRNNYEGAEITDNYADVSNAKFKS
jgi:hypothetical protein